MKKYITHITFLSFITMLPALAQLSPPGLDGTKIVAWGAVGINQVLNPKWTVIAYLGGARMSDPDSWSPVKKQSIGVYDQAVQYKFNNTWQASLCTSIRLQNKYEEEAPYELKNPSYRYELRYYGRLYYKQQLGHFAMNYSFRPEFRTFYSPNWTPSTMPVELRFRVKAQTSLPINKSKTNFLVGGNELLTAIDEYSATLPADHHHNWSNYHFTEDRFSIYFRHVFKSDVVLDLGLMEQFKAGGHFDPVSYLAFDVLFQNPFSKN
ncbi:DUF2490 domain-containing protein [Dyadobacter sp. NIV53]|uniref:DUF2490 domain-containing protein n=1 Tax=Dyadobacter sp. NIV53 TaxID=2861765 RepID=UPI001C8796AC|nr:DUF2490 domain-containing protein [Dyadobacter sp. NIV53]